MKHFVWIVCVLLTMTASAQVNKKTTEIRKTAAKNSSASALPLVHPAMGATAESADGSIRLKLVGQKQNFGGPAETRDADIHSPKSINIHPDGKKYYVNSLEGCTTVSYDFTTNTKLKVIRHSFREGRDDALWAPESGLYPWRPSASGMPATRSYPCS